MLDKPLARSCYEHMKRGRVIFMPGFEQSFDHLYGIYKLRLNDALTNKSTSFSDQEIQDWEIAIKDLEECNVDRLSMCVVQAESFIYYLFLNPQNNELLAIFGGNSRSTIDRSISLNEESFAKGLTVSSLVYESSNLIREWK